MDVLPFARFDFNGAHETPLRNLGSEDEIPKDSGTARRDADRPWRFHNQIGRPKLPPSREVWQSRLLRNVALRCARPHPVGDDPDLLLGQTPRVLKVAVARFGEPWRHIAALCSGHNLTLMPFDVRITQQRKRSGFTRS